MRLIVYIFLINIYFVNLNAGEWNYLERIFGNIYDDKAYKMIMGKYLREFTEQEKEYYIKDEYRKLFNISKDIQTEVIDWKVENDMSTEYRVYKKFMPYEITNFNLSPYSNRVLDVDKLDCKSIANKKFNETNVLYIFCPIKSFNLDKKRLALLAYINVYEYSADANEGAEVILKSIINKSCEVNTETATSLYLKKANFCNDNNQINNIKKALSTYKNIYLISQGNEIVKSLSDLYDHGYSINYGMSYIIIVDKNHNYMVLDYFEAVKGIYYNMEGQPSPLDYIIKP